jgi:hypothetical protein
MDLSDVGWTPPDGGYDVMIDDVATGIKEKNGVNNAWVKPSFTIIDGDFKGRTFTDYYWIQPGAEEPTMSLKNLCRFATCLAGMEIKDPIAAVTIARESKGEFLSLEVFRTTSKKNGKVYSNLRYLSRLEATEADDDVVETTEVK